VFHPDVVIYNRTTHHAQGPEASIVDQKPSLLSESRQVLLARNATLLGQWCEEIVHDRSSEARENDDPIDDHPDIVPSCRVLARCGIVVGKLKELPGMSPSAWEAQMGEGQQDEEVERET
jgi:hypothetical protein